MSKMSKQIFRDEKGRKCLIWEEFYIKEERKGMVCVYRYYGRNSFHFLTSRGNWKSAVKLLKLLNQIYDEAYEDAREAYSNEYY